MQTMYQAVKMNVHVVLSSVGSGSVLHFLASATALDVPVVGRTGKKMDGGNREETGKDKKSRIYGTCDDD